MDSNNSKTRAVVPGRAILGDAGAKREAARFTGGAVVPGKAILGDAEAAAAERGKLDAHRLELARTADPKAATGPLPPKAEKPAGPPPANTPRDVPQPPATLPAGMTEAEVRQKLGRDPNAWDVILAMEAERAGGIRVDVAKSILRAAKRAQKNPVPEAVLDQMNSVITDPGPDEDEEG